MNVQSISLDNQSALISDYRNREESIYTQFHYDPYHLSNFKKRYEYLCQQAYKREELVQVLLTQNHKWGMDQHVKNNIEKLRDSKSVVVIGGQQAGILTGPLYTIHKIISIILQAKEQSEYLQQPVIPVFWIAGEDHDFEEINHVFNYENQRLNKYKLDAKDSEKTPVSNRILNQDELQKWIKDLFQSLQETEYSSDLYRLLIDCIDGSDTFVDYFAQLLNRLFKDTGLVLVDSDDEGLRELEKDYFIQIIKKQEEISTSVVQELNTQAEKGYTISLDASAEDGHLFYHLNGERQLLEKHGNLWITKDEQIKLSQEELIQKVNDEPYCFSNNVVTRPMMQEMVFPVLSFVGGPGEIAYWSVLKQSFEAVGLQFPIVTPRLSLTLLTPKHKQRLNQFGLSLEKLFHQGTNQYKMNWLKRQTSKPVEELIAQMKREVSKLHEPIQDVAYEIQDDIGAYAKSNLNILHDELDTLGKRMSREIKRKNNQTVSYLDELNSFYYPGQGLQERVWNIVYFMNEFGMDLPQRLLNVPPRWEQDHIVVEL
ncbi:bacillithiol biosynthesis cysteine-adding enzyme BshC [Filobacillus milosensis]|uniref:Putative cysteine ligase BshC n=1 Tax=Filobacillus milosensis TaxID=94137 RepID=A0A4Y8IPB2_9BACI|nr:bacillithiol biosynthesis cysteine-adding enzyme BshC [Filobacillus milosensis]TFB23307.1 bacillithiol biosynthesis cysteine-adding enzyme BshC [Filobacillus milosensis]